MLVDTDTQLEEDVSPLRRTAGLISSRLGISLVAITGSGFAFSLTGLLSLIGLIGLEGRTSSSSSLISHSTSLEDSLAFEGDLRLLSGKVAVSGSDAFTLHSLSPTLTSASSDSVFAFSSLQLAFSTISESATFSGDF